MVDRGETGGVEVGVGAFAAVVGRRGNVRSLRHVVRTGSREGRGVELDAAADGVVGVVEEKGVARVLGNRAGAHECLGGVGKGFKIFGVDGFQVYGAGVATVETGDEIGRCVPVGK